MAAEIGKKKRRIARIGGMSCGKETSKSLSEEGMIQDDCNLVYNIMQSMNKSQHVMSYQQFQECRSKDKPSGTKKSDQSPSNKSNSKTLSFKQPKKYVPEKTFPLMEKCQKSMKYLKKNRCIPKPRAHVGTIRRLSPNSTASLQPNISSNPAISNNELRLNDNSLKVKQSSCRSKKKEKPKEAKASHSVDNSCDANKSHKNSSVKKPKLFNDVDNDSDNEFEQFLQKHKGKSFRRKSNKTKKNKKVVCATKIAKFTRKTLSSSEDSFESEVECTPTENNTNVDEECPSKRFQRIVEYKNTDDSASDNHVLDTDNLNYDSFSSSEDENMKINKTLNKEINTDYNDSIRIDTLPTERSIFPSPTFSSECKDSLYYDSLKSKCKIPCYVVIKRDPLLDQKVASLRVDRSVISNTVPASDPHDEEDDCVIIIDTSTNDGANRKSENIAPSIESKSSFQEKIISNSLRTSDESNTHDVQNKYASNQRLTCSSNGLELQTEINSRKSQKDEDVCFTLNETTKLSNSTVISNECRDESTSVESSSRYASNLSNNETQPLNCGSATGKETFNVQILSVKSLNESDIIVLSDDNEENDTESVPPVTETKESDAEDPDIEIICIDSSVKKEISINENVKDVLNNGTHNEVKVDMKEGPSGSVSIEDDCIILNDTDLLNKNACSPKSDAKVQSSSAVGKESPSSSSAQPSVSIENDCVILNDPDLLNKNTLPSKSAVKDQSSSEVVINNEKTNSKDEKSSILELLDTIDFNSIRKILNETPAAETRSENIPTETGNSSRNNIETSERTLDSFPEKLKQAQNDASLSQKQASKGATITPIGPSEVKISSSNPTPVEIGEKHPNFVQNSNVLDNENVAGSIRLDNISSNSDYDKKPKIYVSSSAPKSLVSEKEVTSSCKAEPDTSTHSRKNKLSHSVCTKVENHESVSDEMDIIAAKSIQSLSERDQDSIVPLLELYRTEYKRFMNIRSAEQNVSAGLKLLEEKQASRLRAISSCIKSFVKKDKCFHKINNEFGSKTSMKSATVEKDESSDETKKPLEFVSQPSNNSCSDVEKDDKVKIFNKSVVERASEILRSDGPSSSQEVFNHLINSVCAECGKNAVAACSGCAKIYFCSEKCGMSSWNKGHYASCKR